VFRHRGLALAGEQHTLDGELLDFSVSDFHRAQHGCRGDHATDPLRAFFWVPLGDDEIERLALRVYPGSQLLPNIITADEVTSF
jgi:hypothetical protein